MTLTLLYQTHSPFARKALVFAHEAGLSDTIKVVHHETSPTVRNDVVFAKNPLGKVPVLLREGLAPVFDSDIICAVLDTMRIGPSLIPASGEPRWKALMVQAIAQGVAEAGIAVRWETVRRPEGLRYAELCDGYTRKLIESYDWLEMSLDTDSDLHVGHIALATALAWIEFRDLPSFKRGRPRLVEWFDTFEQRPSMRATAFSGETQDVMNDGRLEVQHGL
jgi:glutathione S-transferase